MISAKTSAVLLVVLYCGYATALEEVMGSRHPVDAKVRIQFPSNVAKLEYFSANQALWLNNAYLYLNVICD